MRVRIGRNEKTNADSTMNTIYSALDKDLLVYTGIGKDTHEAALDTKFMVAEIVNNFLVHDDQFFVANIALDIDATGLTASLSVSHDGNDFNPVAPDSKCRFIREAAERLTVTKPGMSLGESALKKFTLKFSLKR